MARNDETNHSKLMRNESTMIMLDDKISGLEKTQIEKFKSEAKKAYRISKTPMKKQNFGVKIRNKSTRNKDQNLFNNIFVNPRKDKLVQLKRNTEIKDEETRKQDKILKSYQEKQDKKFMIYEEVEPDEALEMMREATKKPDNYEIYNKSLLKKLSNKDL